VWALVDKQSDLAFEIIEAKGEGMAAEAEQEFHRLDSRARGR
jgi:hypothetical protein